MVKEGQLSKNIVDLEFPQRIGPPPDITGLYSNDGRWRELTIGFLGRPFNDGQERVARALAEGWREQRHTVFPTDEDGRLHAPSNQKIDVLVTYQNIPLGYRPLLERIPDKTIVQGVKLIPEYGERRHPGHLIGITTIPERLSEFQHDDGVTIIRRAMLRFGVPMMVFVSQDPSSGEITEITPATPEGGINSIPANNLNHAFHELRDTITTLSLTDEMPKKRDKSPKLPREEWDRSPFPNVMKRTGRWMDKLGFLPPPFGVDDHVGNPVARRIYKTWLRINQFSEGAFLVVDPEGSAIENIGTVYCSATGSEGADKRNMQDKFIVPTGVVQSDGTLQIFSVPGIQTLAESVEAREFTGMLEKAPKVRLRREQVDGQVIYLPDENGPIITSSIASIGHAHVLYDGIDPNYLEHVPPNYKRFPYGVGCGTFAMADISNDYVDRSNVVNNPNDPRTTAAWWVNKHGIIWVTTWKSPIEGRNGEPLQGMLASLALFDRQFYGTLRYNPKDIPEYPQGRWREA